MAPIEDVSLLDFDRSNKGASKQRRDQINAEIATMRDLLPLPETSRQRLSQLQIMSLTCVYIRKCDVFEKLFRSKCQDLHLPDSMDFFQALPGFLLVTTREGKLLYISENVTDFLGHSMVDMKTQGDSLYDIVDKRDHVAVQTQLMAAGPPDTTEPQTVSFFCRMNMSRSLKRQSGFGDVKIMHVRGHFIRVNDPGTSSDGQNVFMASCCPLITPELKENLVQNNTMVFKTVHHLDMSFVEVSKTAEYHLGYRNEDLTKTSWYSLIHPDHIHDAKEKHMQLIRSNHEIGNMMTVKMLHSGGTPFWVNVVMHVRQANQSQSEQPIIICINQIITAEEAFQIKRQSHMFTMYPTQAHELWSSQLSTVMSSQEMPVGHWVHQNSISSLSLPRYSSLGPAHYPHHSPVSAYPIQHPIGMSLGQGSKSVMGLSANACSNTPMIQSDTLKAALKRKIQGPQQAACRPCKISRISPDMDNCNGGQGFPNVRRDRLSMESYGYAHFGASMGPQGQPVQFMQQSSYGIGLLTARKSYDKLDYSPMRLVKPSILGEQVVPDVNLPDSYLTPDPSPVSSPQPSTTHSIKSEVMDAEETYTDCKVSTSIFLHALEKLAACNQTDNHVKVVKTKAENLIMPQAMQSQLRKVEESSSFINERNELPIFDAFDIISFFDNLGIPDVRIKVSDPMKMEPKHEIKKEFGEKNTCRENVMCKLPPAMNMTIAKHKEEIPLISPSPRYDSLTDNIIPIMPQCSMNRPTYIFDEELGSPIGSDIDQGDSRSSLKVVSPAMSFSSERSFDDLLSCYPEDGFLPALEVENRSSVLDATVSEDSLVEQKDGKSLKTSKWEQMERFTHSNSFDIDSPQLSEELSPQSNSSVLATEDEMIDGESEFTFSTTLESFAVTEGSCVSSAKGHDILSVPSDITLDAC